MVSPSPWMTVAGRRGVQRPASRAQLVLTTLGTTTSSGKAFAASAASSAWAVLPRPGSSASRKVRCPAVAAATSWAWCGISSRPPGTFTGRGLGQRHAGRGAAGGVLEGPEQRPEQLPGGQPARRGRAGWARWRSRGRGTGWPAGARRPTAARPGARWRSAAATSRRGDSSRARSMPAARSISRLRAAAGLGDLGVLGEQLQQRGVAGGGLGQDRGDAVEALELLAAVRLGAARRRP